MRVAKEATGYSRWIERLLAELEFEVWMGDPAEIKAKRVKKQKFDREDARLLLRLMRENNFPRESLRQRHTTATFTLWIGGSESNRQSHCSPPSLPIHN